MFGTFMTIIIIGYIGYYGYNIVYDLYFDKSGEVVTTAAVDEQEVDIKDELGGFTQFNADEGISLSLIHISEPTRREWLSRMPSSA